MRPPHALDAIRAAAARVAACSGAQHGDRSTLAILARHAQLTAEAEAEPDPRGDDGAPRGDNGRD